MKTQFHHDHTERCLGARAASPRRVRGGPETIARIVVLTCLVVLTGCAVTTQNVRTESTGTNGVVEVRTTSNKAVAWGDARQVIEKLRVSNGKTQSIGLSGLESEATTTNLAPNIKALVELLNALKTP